MHPAIMWWNNARRSAECGGFRGHAGEGGGSSWGERHEAAGESGGDYGGGGSFGVRRPLRFLAYKLELDQRQVSELARILDELKTERAQADVDGRRTVSGFAEAIEGDAFDEAKAGEAASLRVKSAERLRDAVLTALRRIHALLGPEQRRNLAYLVRTGTVTL